MTNLLVGVGTHGFFQLFSNFLAMVPSSHTTPDTLRPPDGNLFWGVKLRATFYRCHFRPPGVSLVHSTGVVGYRAHTNPRTSPLE